MPFSTDDVRAAMQGRYPDFYNQHAVLKSNAGEMRGPCPVHGGFSPNFAVNPDTGDWYCHSGCQDGGDVFQFLMKKDGLTFPDAVDRVAAFAGLSPDIRTPARPAPRPAAKPAPAPEGPFLDGAFAEQLHQNLMDHARVRAWLSDHRGLTTETLIRFQIGLQPPGKDGVWRICFPVFDRQGRLTNIRCHLFAYKPDLSEDRRRALGKTLPWATGLRADLYPLSALEGATEALIVEGEGDAALACQMGFAAVTGTGGAGTWKQHWTEDLRGLALSGLMRVTILYDADEPGQAGARKVAVALAGAVADVRIARYPVPGGHF